MGNDVTHFSIDDTISDVIHQPLFTGFGQFILPLERGYDENMPLSGVSTLLPYHSHIDPQAAVDTMNHMLDEVAAGKTIFYPIYDDSKMQAHTGLFFFRGKPGAPFAVISAGGGFSYVGSIHEGFPLAIQLAEQGYNAFVIQYRTGGQAHHTRLDTALCPGGSSRYGCRWPTQPRIDRGAGVWHSSCVGHRRSYPTHSERANDYRGWQCRIGNSPVIMGDRGSKLKPCFLYKKPAPVLLGPVLALQI